ncbi:MAG TPA: hypothetical protein QF517_02790 [Pseudomonadales bacterium]|jgi:hypothetical protein|nr:hypothetical protein [Pseudomonadales bacterium]MDP6316074.1 hypothetical protein [Pseudomonadales bacterium]MDP7316129.1 hypothetical protein [Pseudomonadales bacterium]MDP7575874.1 hypothetical protein [Pseudomonadales bacterium]HJL60858.1 hypothetical protein [Pseudomonadales bacterium]|tara:strand:- start:3456 stop:3662 length:207 start_codon:yes stop_codon:yes gene_type:complete
MAGQLKEMQARWQKQLQELAELLLTELLDDGNLIAASNSGHYIHMDEPELVVNVIAEILEKSHNPSFI